MIFQLCFLQVAFLAIGADPVTELLPERYLQPQDFNHHPFTDVGIPAALKKAASHPYAILASKRPREGREFPPQNVVYYPTPHPSVLSRKQVETNEIGKYDDPYVKVPKNYAFSYIVKDHHSGDDFSHSQAHNGKATKGQYRVKLPDGRTQIVSYTADHKGYRADVQYEEDYVAKPLFQSAQHIPQTPAKLPEGLPNTYQGEYEEKPAAQVVYTTASTLAPVQYPAVKLVVKSTAAPQYYQPQFVSTTPTPYHQGQYVSSSTSGDYVSQHYVSSTPLYPVVSTTAAPQAYQQAAVIVTPRPIYTPHATKTQQHSGVLYRLL